jgi:predicted RNA binding protein YcfA (HicA-like mRNA interferase family)
MSTFRRPWGRDGELPIVDWSHAAKAFAKVGWVHARTRGSHYIMVRPNRPGLLSIPMHRPLKRGTLRSLIRDAGMSVEEFNAHR